MSTHSQLNLCKAYLYSADSQKKRQGSRVRDDGPVVTISRQAGARGNSIAAALVPVLDESEVIPKHRPWTVFNQNLLDCIIREHQLPERTADYFPEDKPDEIRSLVGELLGLHPGVYTSVRKAAETIRRLAMAGNAILVGRGAHLVTANLHHALHVRLVGNEVMRARHFAKLHNLAPEQAADEVAKRDRARRRYVKANFRQEIEDPCQYDLVINTDRVSNAAVAAIIRLALEAKYR